jgi:hypothetical protein
VFLIHIFDGFGRFRTVFGYGRPRRGRGF